MLRGIKNVVQQQQEGNKNGTTTCLSFPITKWQRRSMAFLASSLFFEIANILRFCSDSCLSTNRTLKALSLSPDHRFKTRTKRQESCCRLLWSDCSITQYLLCVTSELRRDRIRSPLDTFPVREVFGAIIVPYQNEAPCAWVTRMVSDLQPRAEHVLIILSKYSDTQE
jgi:hypothetical protein